MNLTFARFGRLVRLSAAALALMTVVACKPSVEGETRTWESNRLTLQEWVGKFPNFKPAIDGRMAEAQADFDAAKAIGDADERAAKMREANNKLSTLTSAFQDIDRKIREFETLKNDQQLLRLPGTILMPAMNASQAMLADARRRLDGPVNNAGEAVGRLRDASQAIERAMTPLRQARAQVQQQNQQGRPGQPGQPGMGQPPGAMGQPGQMQGGMGQPGGMPGQQPMGMARPMGAPGVGGPAMGNPGLGPQGQLPPQGAQGMGMQMAPGVAPGAGAPPPGVMPQGAAPGGAPPAAGGAKPF
jgi:hypothetical protein